LVLLDPDVAGVFPDSKSVNEALRSLVRIVERRKAAPLSVAETSAEGVRLQTRVNLGHGLVSLSRRRPKPG
jgi:hypothetical protein